MVGKPVHSILSWEPESREDLKYFRTIPWCSKIVSSPNIRPYQVTSPLRCDRGPDPVIHGFMFRQGGVLRHASLLADPGTIPSLHVVDKPVIGGPGEEKPDQNTRLASLETTAEEEYPVHVDIFTFGDSLQAVPGTIHGGVLTLLADGVCGKTAWMHRDPLKQVYTAYTNVRFIKPLLFGPDGTVTTVMKTQVIQELSTEGKIMVYATMEGPG